ncbi:MAG: hypothetical protein FWG02_10350 [Holophagaceae bacterium]|nr:hypothetical protein [Holophagaceae bacterium]
MQLPSILTPTALALCLGLSLSAQTQQARTAPPPEQAELNAAMNITDLNARLKELQRIMAAYPESRIFREIKSSILRTVSQSADTLEKLLVAQKEVISSAKLQDRFSLMTTATSILFSHSKAANFSKSAVLEAVQDYKNSAMQLLSNPDFISTIPENRREASINTNKTAFELSMANAHLMNGNAQSALTILEEYKKTGQASPVFYNLLGQSYTNLNRHSEALEAFLDASVNGMPAATASAKAAYEKVHGSEAGFTDRLKALQTSLPFHPPPFKAPENWQGKAVLAELFTGSECPPCVAADFAFDGLIESYPAKHLVILEYHLPIPRYDPMMNPATKARQDYYKVSSTPTVIIDGATPASGGGGRAASEATFNRYKDVIDPIMGSATPVAIRASAKLSDQTVTVNCEFSKVVEGADYNVVLVQRVQEFAGYNGIVHHKMVVRDIATVAPNTTASITFNLPNNEKATDAHIAEWGKTAADLRRIGPPATSWPMTISKINRSDLQAVVFVQDKESKQVHNAFIVDVK